MHLGQIEAFLEIARGGSVKRAAALLNIGQPALTSRIQLLEREFGAPLFERSTRGMRLTPAGKALVPFAERALSALRDGGRMVDEIGRGAAGDLTLAVTPWIAVYALPLILAKFGAARRSVVVHIQTTDSLGVHDLVRREQAHVGLARSFPHDPDLIESRLYDDELVLVTSAEHRLATRSKIGMSELTGEELVLHDREPQMNAYIMNLLAGAGVPIRSAMYVDSGEAAKKMVEHGVGVSILPLTSIASEIAQGTLHAVFIDVSPRQLTHMVVLRRRGTELSPVAEAFIAVATEAARTIRPKRRGAA